MGVGYREPLFNAALGHLSAVARNGRAGRRGQKSATVVFWKLYGQDAETEETAGDELTPSADERTRCFARAYHVFNADQVDGFEVPVQPLISESNRIQDAERFFTNTGARVIEGGNRAYYHSSLDEIHMPPFQAFKKADLFYSTLGHECVHFTAPPGRCNRQLSSRFGSEAYAMEELIAEVGSAFLSAELHLDTEPRIDNAPYVENWLRVLKSDKRAIFAAASKAQQATQWLVTATERSAAA